MVQRGSSLAGGFLRRHVGRVHSNLGVAAPEPLHTAAGVDKDPADTSVALSTDVELNSFVIEFFDSSQLGDARDGTGVDPFSISAESVIVTQIQKFSEHG